MNGVGAELVWLRVMGQRPSAQLNSIHKLILIHLFISSSLLELFHEREDKPTPQFYYYFLQSHYCFNILFICLSLAAFSSLGADA